MCEEEEAGWDGKALLLGRDSETVKMGACLKAEAMGNINMPFAPFSPFLSFRAFSSSFFCSTPTKLHCFLTATLSFKLAN